MKKGEIIYKNNLPYTIVEVYNHDRFAIKEKSILWNMNTLWLSWGEAVRYYINEIKRLYSWPWPTTCWTVVKVDRCLPAWNTVAPIEFFDWYNYL